MRRLLLVRHGATSATRAGSFPADEPLDARGLADAASLRGALPSRCAALTSPALRCRQTAEAAGAPDPTVVDELAACDFGAWAGRTLAAVHDEEPDAVGAWMTDPHACPHDGESLAALTARVGGWLDDAAAADGWAVAFTHGEVVKAAVVHALGAPPEAFWRIDVAPLAITELHAHDERWTVTRVNHAVAADGGSSLLGRAASGEAVPA